jgi:hypothetical protein
VERALWLADATLPAELVSLRPVAVGCEAANDDEPAIGVAADDLAEPVESDEPACDCVTTRVALGAAGVLLAVDVLDAPGVPEMLVAEDPPADPAVP